MENKEWDDSLKDMLGDYKPDGLQPDWDAFSNYLHVHEQTSEWEDDHAFDESLKETVSDYHAPAQVEGWERVEASLNLADQQFDEHVRNKIHRFEPQYNPRTWPLLMQRLSGIAYLRAKLIAFKVVEVAAVMLLLFTVVKMGQMGKLPFETPLFENSKQGPGQGYPKVEMADNASRISPDETQSSNSITSFGTTSLYQNSTQSEHPPLSYDQSGVTNQSYQHPVTEPDKNLARAQDLIRNSKALNPIPFQKIIPLQNGKDLAVMDQNLSSYTAISVPVENSANEKNAATNLTLKRPWSFASTFISTILSPVRWNHQAQLPAPQYIKQRSRTYTEFGIVSQLDYNLMRMPEDRLYSAGRQIIFPQQGIPSSSLGGGFSFAMGHPRWAIETGLTYSAKNFKPGRQLIVGDAFDNGSVEFEAMRLQLISIPLQYRYRFDNTGVFKFYGLAGFGVHLITQSDIDVLIKYHFPSLSIGDNPNNYPELAQTIRETRRISEHIRDGAPFSTKSFFSANAGAGIEYSITENKTLFLQSAFQYQVPNLKFSNNNGKHIRSVSIQAGVRTPLGK